MASSDNRPVHLNLFLIRMPVPAVMSIAHRASGVLMVLCTPVLIYLLELSLQGPQGFARAQGILQGGVVRLLLLLVLWALLHHLFAGIRYLLLDVHIGVDKAAERASAWAVMLGAPLAALVPYSVTADGLFTISMDSISSGFRSFSRPRSRRERARRIRRSGSSESERRAWNTRTASWG